jgi:SprT protein
MEPRSLRNPADPSRGDADLADAIRHSVARYLDRAEPLFRERGIEVPDPELRFDLRGTAAGQCRWIPGRRPELRFNLALARLNRVPFVAQTVPHEVAHLVTTACHGRTRPHGPEWRSVMAHFGLPDAPTRHAFEIPAGSARRQQRWTYRCDCRRHELSTTRHKRVESGRSSYQCRHCGEPLRRVTNTRN